MKWVDTKAKATTKSDARATTWFLYEYVFTRYGLPIEIVSDRGTHFINEVVQYLLEEFMIVHKKISTLSPTSKWPSRKHEQDSLHSAYQNCRKF